MENLSRKEERDESFAEKVESFWEIRFMYTQLINDATLNPLEFDSEPETSRYPIYGIVGVQRYSALVPHALGQVLTDSNTI